MQNRNRQLLALGLALLMALVIPSVLPVTAASQTPVQPYSLSVSILPQRLPADGGTYPAVVVSLVDQNDLPTIAVSNVTAFLFSSGENVARVSSKVVIPAGGTYAVANLTTTVTPGSATITASSAGLQSTSAVVTTETPSGFPSTLKVFLAPDTAVARPNSAGVIVVELLDQTGLPTKAASSIAVQLSSSSPLIANTTSSVLTINASQTLAFASFVSSYRPGQSFITASASGLLSGTAAINVVGPAPLQLHLYAQPSKLQLGSTGRLAVSLADSGGDPARAPETVTVQLRSSNETVVTSPQEVIIPAGQTYAVTDYTSSDLVGSATVTASSPGLQSSSVVVKTAVSSSPVQLAVYVGPTPVPADDSSYSAIVVALQNKTGGPAVAPDAVTVQLTSSDSDVGSVAQSLTVPAGSSFASASFNSTFFAGSTSISASASNLLPSQAQFSTFGSVPAQLRLEGLVAGGAAGSGGPQPVLSADGGSYNAIVVLLEDSSGSPAIAPTNTVVQLFSTQSSVVGVSTSVTISAGSSFAVMGVQTSTLPGKANITASAPGLTSSSITVSTEIPAPSAITAYVSPAKTITSQVAGQPYLAVQLQDANGNPARARSRTEVTVTSASSSVMASPVFITIPQGADYVIQKLDLLSNGTTTLTVTSPGLSSSSVPINILSLPLTATLEAAPTSILSNGISIVTASVTLLGKPMAGAHLGWNVTGGTLGSLPNATNAVGIARTVFTPDKIGVAEVEAFVSSPVIGLVPVKVQIVVTQVPPTPPPTLAQRLSSYLIFIIAAVVVVVAVAVVIFRRRRARMKEELEAAFQTLS